MKRFFMSCVITVVALFLGFTAYYFLANNERITLASPDSACIKMNVGDTLAMDDIIKRQNPKSTTVINVDFSVEGILSYNKTTHQFKAEQVGSVVVKLIPSNTKFGPFILSANVGDGSSAELPYYIRTESELSGIGKTEKLRIDMSYELISDIYLTNAWTPIATYNASFNGGEHVIYDMTINQDCDHAGLFSQVGPNGTVKNVRFVNANISGSFNSAGFVAGDNQGTISLCYVLESTISNNLAGMSTGAIAGNNIYVSTGDTMLSARIGMCGVESLTLSAVGFAGGIVGVNTASIVEACYANVLSVSGNNTLVFGGVVGKNQGATSPGTKISTIYKSHAYINAVNEVALFGGIVAQNLNAASDMPNAYVRCYHYEANTSGSVAPTISGVEARTQAEMSQKTNYETWDFVRIWKMSPQYAVLNLHNAIYVSSVPDVVVPGGDDPDPTPPGPTPPVPTPPGPTPPSPSSTYITLENVWTILNQIKQNPNSGKKYYIQNSFVADYNNCSVPNLFPLCSASNPLCCSIYTLNDSAITFKNVNLNTINASLFGYIGRGTVITGINVANSDIKSTQNGPVGAIACSVAQDAAISKCVVSYTSLTGQGNIGALAGESAGAISSCSVNNITITGNGYYSVGALVGYNNGSVTSCQGNNNSIAAQGVIGGLVGTNNSAVSKSDCFGVSINAQVNNLLVGGAVGSNSGAIYAVKVQNGNISANTNSENSYAGGLVAQNNSNVNYSSVLSTSVSAYYAGGISALNKGVITVCVAGKDNTGSVAGVFSGGLTAINQINGRIENCVVGTVMQTLPNSQKTCGMAFKLEENSVISHCFSYAKFNGTNGDRMCDTDTPFRNGVAGIWQHTPLGYIMGKIENSFAYNMNSVKIWGVWYLPDIWDPAIHDFEVSREEAMGANNWQRFYQAGFDFNIWKRVSGQYFTVNI